MATYTTPLSMPRRQQTPSANTTPNHQHQQQLQTTPPPPPQLQRLHQLNASTSSVSAPASPSSSASAFATASKSIPSGIGGFTSTAPGLVKSKTAPPTTPGGSATLAPGRRLQYQLPVSSRLDGNNQYQQYQYQQQQGGLGSSTGSNSGASPGSSSSSVMRLHQAASSPTSPSVKGSPSSLSHHHQHQLQPQQQRQHAVYSNSNKFHNLNARQDGPGGPGSSGVRGPHMMNATSNTQTMMASSNIHTQAGMTATATNTQTGMTGMTGMTDKPKSRKKDKPPRIPPPEEIHDNNGKMSYTRGPALGEGGFASCYMISDQKNDRYAAKVIQKTELLSHKTRQKLFAEIKIHQSLNNENIVKYYHCFEDDDFVYLVLELCESKTLMELVKRRKRLTEPEVRFYMKELVAGCAYLHKQKTIHRDLKLGNLFLTHDMHIRIGDFGLAAVIMNAERKKTICGTPNYIAPEILFDTDNGHSFEVDIWSVGVIMYTLLIGKPPFQTPEVKAIYKKIRDNNYTFPEDIPISSEAKNLIAALLNPSPASRPSVAKVLNHPFFSSGYCPDKLDRKSLSSTPNYELEDIMVKQRIQQEQRNLNHRASEQQQLHQPSIQEGDNQESVEELARSTARNTNQGSIPLNEHIMVQQPQQQQQQSQQQQKNQLLYDQSSYGGVSPSFQPTRVHRDGVDVEEMSVNSSSPLAKRHTQQTTALKFTPTRPATFNRLSQAPSPLTAPALQYGEQVKMEMVDGGRVTTEIRTINVNRGGTAPNLQQYPPTQSHLRQDLHKHQHQIEQQRQPNISPATGNDISASSVYHGSRIESSHAHELSNFSGASPHFQQQQSSASQPGPSLSVGHSFSQQDAGISASVPSLTVVNGATSSRLPIPKARSFAFNSGTMQQGGPQSSLESASSTQTKSGFLSSYSNPSSPRPPSSVTMSGTAPNLQAYQKYQDVDEQESHSALPLPMVGRRSSDIANIPGGSTFGKSPLNRKQESEATTHLGRTNDESQSIAARMHRLARTAGGLISLDTDMEIDQDLSQHLDLLVTNTSDVISQPAHHAGGGSRQQRSSPHGVQESPLSQQQQQQQQQDRNPFLRSSSQQSLQDSSRQSYQQSSQQGGVKMTLIQNVHGGERPASVMQRTHSQEWEVLDANRASEPPRKRSVYSKSIEPPSQKGTSRFTPSPLHSSQLGSQPQSHSFSPSSLQGSPSPYAIRQHSSLPLSQSQQQYPLQHMPSSPSLRMSNRNSQQWPADLLSLGLNNQDYSLQSQNARDRPSSPTPLPRSNRSQSSQQVRDSPSQASSQESQEQGMGLGLTEAEGLERLGGMVSGAAQDNMYTNESNNLDDHFMHQQQQQDSETKGSSQKQRLQLQSQQSQGGIGIEDPYRYQISSPLQLRNQQAKQQQQQSVQSQSPKASSSLTSRAEEKVYAVSQTHSWVPSQERSQPQSPHSQYSQHSHHSQHLQQQDDHNSSINSRSDSNGGLSFQGHRRPSRHTASSAAVASTGLSATGSDLEESSIDQSLTREAFDTKRQMQIEMRRKLHRNNHMHLASSQEQERELELEQEEQEEQQRQRVNADAAGLAATNNIKQSNETTMGMSSGGHSDEHDHVEVPSTSCVTTASMSLSIHHDRSHHQQKHQQQQLVQEHEVDVKPKHLEGSQKRTHKKVSLPNLEPVNNEMHLTSVGTCEEVEQYLRTMIHARRDGILGRPDFDAPAPKPPPFFVTRWIDYKRYGIGWQVANGVIGVFFNDKTTLALSPNGMDLEILEPVHRRKVRSSSSSSTMSRKNSHKDKNNPDSHRRKDRSSAGSSNRVGSHSGKNNSNSVNSSSMVSSTAMGIHSTQTVAESMADLRAVLEMEAKIDEEGDYQMMVIYDDKNNAVTPSLSRSVSQVDGSNLMSASSVGTPVVSSAFGVAATPQGVPRVLTAKDYYDDWDHAEFLANLDRTNCRINKYPTRFEKRMKLLNGFKNYMIQKLSGPTPWVYEDLQLTKGLPFLTDLYHKKHTQHVILRLSNGIVQFNFADHTKMILSEHGQVLTFLDHDTTPRRITMTVHQALSPEYFYDLEDESDQNMLVWTELEHITLRLRRQWDLGRSMVEYEELRPIFDPQKAHDLWLFPRPCLALKEVERLRQSQQGNDKKQEHEQEQNLPGQRQLRATEPLQQELQHHRRLSQYYSSNYPLAQGIDASQVDVDDILRDSAPLKLSETTLKELHFQLVRRLRLGLKLLQERKLELAKERYDERVEREQFMKDREEYRRRKSKQQLTQGENENKVKMEPESPLLQLKQEQNDVKVEVEREDRANGDEREAQTANENEIKVEGASFE